MFCYFFHRRRKRKRCLSAASTPPAGMTDDVFKRTLLHDVLCSDFGPAKSDALRFEARRQPRSPSTLRCVMTGRMWYI